MSEPTPQRTPSPIDDLERDRQNALALAPAVRIDSLRERHVVALAPERIGRVLDCNEDGEGFPVPFFVVASCRDELLEGSPYAYTVIELTEVPHGPVLVEVKAG